MKVTIHPKDFSNFLRCLDLLKDKCNDVQIKGGVLRQRSNFKESIFEMHLSPLISDANIILSNVKQKLPMLKQLSQQGEVVLISTDDNLSFLSKRSMLKFINPRKDFLDNKFIPDEDICNLFTLTEDNLIVEYPFTKDTCQLMKVMSKQFNIVSFQMVFKGNEASIIASTLNKDQYSQMESGIPIKKTVQGFSNIATTPFFIDHDDEILLRMHNTQETIFINKFSTTVGKVNVNLYGRSQLINEDEEEEYFNPSKEVIDPDVTEKE
jgi:hypothetical protein